MKVK
jgi:hypothetical protein